jgi:hypothetical protein
MSGLFRTEEIGGIVLLRSVALEQVGRVAHAFSTRVADGRGDFDLGGAEGADAATEERRRRFFGAAGLSGRPALVRQVHGSRLVRAPCAADLPEADGVFWSSNDGIGWVPSVRTADCVPLLLADREGRAAAAVHAGWRGTVAGVAREAVRWFVREGIPPGRLVAALGPAILGCCYEVAEEVAEAIEDSLGAGAIVRGKEPKPRVDLQEANRMALVAAGVPSGSIHLARFCTRCRPDLFFSYRREGAGTGRMMASIGPSRGA